MEAEGRHLRRPKADFKGGVGGRSRPMDTSGDVGGAVASPQKELLEIAKSGTLKTVAVSAFASSLAN